MIDVVNRVYDCSPRDTSPEAAFVQLLSTSIQLLSTTFQLLSTIQLLSTTIQSLSTVQLLSTNYYGLFRLIDVVNRVYDCSPRDTTPEVAPTPYTLNPKFLALSPKPKTLNPKLKTIHSKP